MKKFLVIALCIVMGMPLCHAQYTEKKTVIALGNYTGQYAKELHEAVIASAAKCRVSTTIVEWDEVKNDSTLAASVDYILSGNTGSISVSETRGQSYTFYLSALPFGLTMTDAKSGQVIDSRSTQRKSSQTDRNYSIEDCKKLEGSVRAEYNALIYKNCAIRVPIQVIQDVKKNKAQTVIIAGGTDIGICEGLTFDVQMESEIAGKKIYKTIGEAKVKELLSGELTLCEIIKGHKEVLKMFDDEMTLVLTSNDKDSFGETINKIGKVLFH